MQDLTNNLRKYAEQALINHDNCMAEDLEKAATAIECHQIEINGFIWSRKHQLLDIKKAMKGVVNKFAKRLKEEDGVPMNKVDSISKEIIEECENWWLNAVSKLENGQVSKERRTWRDEYFGPLLQFIQDDNVTGVYYNGADVWVDDLTKGRYKSNITLTAEFVNQFSTGITDLVSKPFDRYNPLLKAEVDALRISSIHERVAGVGRCISIRKMPIILKGKSD